jgi:hypothetical protein
MTDGSRASAVAYKVEDVERYVEAVALQRAELELAILHARARIVEASPLEDRITALERRVAELIAERATLGRPDASIVAWPEGTPRPVPEPKRSRP